MGMIAQDIPTRQIAIRLGVSIHTINSHRKNAMKKFGVHTQAALIYQAICQGELEITENGHAGNSR